jgi:glycine/D-amino acid oxidase-like deaminating enzyme
MNIGVVGGGIFGVTAALELRARGHTVTLLEQGTIPNDRASSTDAAKTIRRLYGRNATYVELAERSAARWQTWHERLGRTIYFRVGQLEIVDRFEPGTRPYESWRYLGAQGSAIEILTPQESRKRFPQFAYRPGDTCVFDPWGGYLASSRAMAGLGRMAREAGVVVRERTRVTGVEECSKGIWLGTAGELIRFDRVALTAGVWLGQLVPGLRPHLRPTLQQMAFFAPATPERFAAVPVWSVNADEEGWYGHPLLSEGVVKVANDLLGPGVDPDADRHVTDGFLAGAHAFVAQRLPALADAELVGGRACLYENTPDRHFIIDWAPGSGRILVAGGGSGHAFKFGGSLGDLIADALEERDNPLGALFRTGSRFQATGHPPTIRSG